MAKKTDEKTLQLIAEVKKQKEEIARAERPNWITNCSFSYTTGAGGAPTNIHVEANIPTLVSIVGFLLDKERSYNEAAKVLGTSTPDFTWGGFSVKDWISDIKQRIDKIQIATKRKKLEALEARLNAIISPELRAQMELDAIANELG
jgi:hypothetical protein